MGDAQCITCKKSDMKKKESSQKSETLFFHIRYFCKILFYLECNKQLATLIKLISWLLTQYPIAHLPSIDKVNKWIFICYSYMYTVKIIEEWLITSKWLRFFVLLWAGNFCWARNETNKYFLCTRWKFNFAFTLCSFV